MFAADLQSNTLKNQVKNEMSGNNIPIIEPAIDYTEVPPINQKRMVSFINHFLIHMVNFLNKFSLDCEERLFNFECKLQKVEASLEILESRLSSVPELQEEKGKEQETPQLNSGEEDESTKEQDNEESVENNEETTTSDEPAAAEQATTPVSQDPRYVKYFKMVQVGVPRLAVKAKMAQDGLDSSILDER